LRRCHSQHAALRAPHSFPTRRSSDLRVTEVLRNEIIDGHRQPGEKLVERNLATELGVSRVPIREALKKLASEELDEPPEHLVHGDRKSTRLNSSHVSISYAVFCLKKK